nr:sigma 54-interacting transcriptional regulator [uncultured Sphaerochaeta sp.]
MIKISFIVPYASLQLMVKEILEQHPQREILEYSIIPKTVDKVEQKDLAADIVIARGLTAQHVKALSVPVIDMTVTGFDITIALHTCMQKYNPSKIAVVGPINTIYGIEELKDVFPCELESYLLDDSEKVKEIVSQVRKEGAEAIIAGLTVYSYCIDHAIACTLIETGRKTIRQAIDEAIRSVLFMKREQERTDRFKSIMDYSMEGIISVNHDRVVTVANAFALRVFPQLEHLEENLIKIDQLFPQISVPSVIKEGCKVLGELIAIRDRTYTINCVPSGDTGAVITFSTVSKIQEMEGRIRSKLHKKGLIAKYTFDDIVGTDNSIVHVKHIAQKYSRVDSNICILGETGTGKELFAQSIHNASERKNEPFVAINCAALAEDLLESELFGYEEGAFTGAVKGGKTGLFELAHNGTIFLDEIGDITLKMQSRLLRVIQEREIMRIGHGRVIPINIRIIAASNKNLRRLVAEGQFREDLYYRLNILQLTLPPLRERKRDIIALCDYFIQLNEPSGFTSNKVLTPAAQHRLIDYSWPGNIRELSNFCERLSVLSEEASIDTDIVDVCIDQSLSDEQEQDDMGALSSQNAKHEREMIANALSICTTKREVADLLGINPSTLWRKIRKYGLE